MTAIAVFLLAALVAALSALASAYRNFAHNTLEELARKLERQKFLVSYMSGMDRDTWTVHILWSMAMGALLVLCFETTLATPGVELASAVGQFVLLVAVLLVLAVGVPAAIAEPQAERVVLATVREVRLVSRALSPLYLLWHLLRRYGARLSGAPREETPAETIAEEILSAAVEGELEGALGQEQKDMIEGVIHFHQGPVSEIMTPRTDIVFLQAETTIEDAQRIAVQSGFSRYPVFENSRDDIVGVIHVRDLLADASGISPKDPVQTCMRPPYLTPETTPVGELLEEMRRRQVHLAIVLDEYGGTAGLVTLEDILEEIVGEIEDEFSPVEEEPIRVLDDRRFELSGRARIEDINTELGVELPSDLDFETVGGFVFHVLGHLPQKGEVVTHDNLRLTVMEATKRQAKKLLLEKLPRENDTISNGVPDPE